MARLVYNSKRTRQPFRKWIAKWHEILKSYEETYQNDLPYWHSERTNIGIFSLAAYDLNGYPIQEYPTLKRKRKKSQGRADLYVQFPGGWSYDIEAKQAWPKIKIDGTSVKSSTKGALMRAEKDCRGLAKKARSGKGLAVAFVCPYGEERDIKKEYLNAFRKQIKEVEIELIEKGSAPDFIAVHQVDFKHSKNLTRAMPKEWWEQGKRYWYPCIAIVGKVI